MMAEKRQSTRNLRVGRIPLSFGFRAIVPALAFALLVASFPITAPESHAGPARPTYSCPSPYHCYGINKWPGGPINGVETDDAIVSLSCDPSLCVPGDFVDNEMWLATGDGGKWVEAGYTTFTSWIGQYLRTRTDYFWAHTRPGYSYLEYDLDTVPYGDYANYAHLYISRTDSQTFEVVISSPNYYFVDYSTNNSMTPALIEIGQELSGSGGASAQTGSFINNYWIDTSNQYHSQYLDGSIRSDAPPHAGWVTPPSSSSTGGSLYTWCC